MIDRSSEEKPAARPEPLIYMYGIVLADAPDPPDDLLGIDGRPTGLVRLDRVAAVISEVSAERYADDALNGRLDDLNWVGERGMEHERVLDWFVDRGAVLPLSLFSLHHDLERVEKRLSAEESSFHSALTRLAGRREWGIKLWRHESAVAGGIDSLSPSLTALKDEIEAAPPGKRFLLERKRDTMRAEEVRTLSGRIAHELFSSLKAVSDNGVSMRLPAGVAGAERTLLLHAAYLVKDSGFEDFQRVVTEQAARVGAAGFEVEFTGPWPAYHFTEEEDD